MELELRHGDFMEFFSATPTALLLVGADGCIKVANPRTEELTGYSSAELQAMSVEELVPDGVRADHAKWRQGYMDDPVFSPMADRPDLVLQSSSGELVAVSISLSPVKLHGERFILAVMHDLTSERAAAENRDLLALVAENVGEMILILDRDLHCLWANSAYLDYVGFSPEQIRGHHIREVAVKRKLSDELWNEFHETVLAGRFFRYEDNFPSPEGLPLRLVVEGIPADDYVVIRLIDVTRSYQSALNLREQNVLLEERVAERTLALQQAKEEAENSSRAKGTFLATMSHEIRTPLHGVIASLDLLNDSSFSEAQQRYYRNAQISAENLRSILDEVLDFTQIDSGIPSLEQTVFWLREVVEKTVIGLHSLAEQNDVRLILFVAPELDQSAVAGDQRYLTQILTNLIGNAIKFSAPQHNAKVVINCEVESVEDDSSRVLFKVSDNGIGMSVEQLSRVFEPFVQAEDDTSRRFGGTGLGLAIIKRLVTALDGTIEVSSEPGVGTTFSVSLPFVRSTDLIPPSLPFLDGQRVLVLPGTSELGRVLKRYLEHAGAEVNCCHEEDEEALKLLIDEPERINRYSAVLICDLRGDTLPLTQQLSQTAKAPPLLFIEERDSFTAGSEPVPGHVIRRPICLKELVEQVSTAIGNSDKSSAREYRPGTDDHHSRGRVLVAEDQPINRDLICAQLERLGYETELAEDGAEALASFSPGRFNAVLTDCHMPRVDGYELAKQIRSIETSQGVVNPVPVLALTADITVDQRQRCLDVGINDVLNKPLKLAELKEKMGQWVVPDINEASVPADSPDQSQIQPIDLSIIAEMIPDKPEHQQRMFQDFLASFANFFEAMELFIRKHDFEAFARRGHGMGSVAMTFGAERLAAACAQAGQFNSSSGSEQLATRVLDDIRRACEEIETYCANNSLY